MIHLYYANRLDSLLEPLAERLKPGSENWDPFLPASIVVPNANLRQWLQLHLAERNQIAVNIRFSWLDHELIHQCMPSGTSLINPRLLQMMAVRLLTEYQHNDEPELQPLRTYMEGPGHPDTRAFQLATRLTELFRQYGFSRGDLLRAWEQNRDDLIPSARPVERWQRRLWRDLFVEGGLIQRRNTRPELHTKIPINDLCVPHEPSHREPLHLFGLSYLSRFHQRILRDMATSQEIHLYVLNPCRAFWEDMRTRKEESKRQLALHGMPEHDLFEHEENPLLQAWGRPGREYMRRLNELAEYDFYDCFSETGTNTILKRLQTDILNRECLPKKPPFKENDQSIRVLGCASPRREAEAVASEIWDMLRGRAELSLRDIAVIVSDMGVYQPEIEAAFQRLHGLRFNLVDGRTGRATRLLDAIRSLFSLADSRYTREAVFDLFQHPNFQARYPEADPAHWLTLVDQLNVFHGRGLHDQQQEGMTYLDKDLYNWDQAFTRLTVGAYLHANTKEAFAHKDREYASFPLGEGSAENARLLYMVARSLFEDTTQLPSTKLSSGGWAYYFRRLIETYLAPLEGEEGDFQKIVTMCANLAELEEAFDKPESPISFQLARDILFADLQSLTPHIGQYLTGGVTVSSFMPMRPVPFKVVFVMGLDESRFPSRPRKDTLDLRWTPRSGASVTRPGMYREIGDVSDSERDRYMFLETLVSTGDTLVLSYVNRNDTTEDLINPSPVLEELMQALHRFCDNFAMETQPLKAYDDAHAARHDPRAARLSQFKGIRETFTATETEAIEDATFNWPRQLLIEAGLSRPKAEEQARPDQVVRLNLTDLRAFLRCPLQATARRVLRQHALDADLASINNEPFSFDFGGKLRLLEDVLETVLQREGKPLAEPLIQAIKTRLMHAELAGQAPAGKLLGVVEAELQRTMETWLDNFERLGSPSFLGRPRFGDTIGPEDSLRLPPLQLTVPLEHGNQAVEIHGTTRLLFEKPDNPDTMSVNFSFAKDSKNATVFGLRLLDGFLDAMALAASDFRHRVSAVLIPGEPGDPRFRAWSTAQDEARQYLQNLAADILTANHFYLLPADIAAKTWSKRPEDFQKYFEQQLEAARRTDDRFGHTCASAQGPFDRWRQAPSHQQAKTAIDQRLGKFFEAIFDDKDNP